jgi:hypothetical protein
MKEFKAFEIGSMSPGDLVRSPAGTTAIYYTRGDVEALMRFLTGYCRKGGRLHQDAHIVVKSYKSKLVVNGALVFATVIEPAPPRGKSTGRPRKQKPEETK